MDVTWEDLGALLRFRYGTVDPQMAALERCHIQAMHDFGKGLPHKMYEEGAGVFIKKQMDEDLETMREGGVVVVNEDF